MSGTISRPKMGLLLDRFTGKKMFLFDESKLFHQSVQYPERSFHPHWGVRQIMEIDLFWSNSL